MSYQMSFATLVQYDPGQPSITVTVTLSLSQDHINCEAKVDTGASLCIFARDLGEQLGLEIESGMRQLVGTVTGTFVVYLHKSICPWLAWSAARSLASLRMKDSDAMCWDDAASSNKSPLDSSTTKDNST